MEFAASDMVYRDITINATNNLPWTATTTSGFVLHPSYTALTGDGLIRVRPAQYNRGLSDITGVITISSSSVTATVDTTQFKPMVRFDGTGSTFDCYATSFTLTVSAETDWSAVTSTDWISMSSTSGASGVSAITITLAKNTEQETETEYQGRIGVIEFNYTEYGIAANATYTIKQNKWNLVATLDEYAWSFHGGQATLTITTDRYWEVSGETWMTIGETSGHGDTSITVTYGSTSTSRNGVITISDQEDADFYVEVDVTQQYIQLSVSYDIDWPQGKPQITTGSTDVTITFPREMGINWYNIESGAYGKRPVINYFLVAWDSGYTEEVELQSWQVLSTDFIVPSNTGRTIQYFDNYSLTAPLPESPSNYEFRTYFDSNPSESVVVNYNYSGANWNSVYEPAIGVAKYSNVTYGGRANNVTRTSEGGAMYHYRVSGWFDIDFVLDENALNCPFNIYVTAIVGQGTNTYTFSGTITGTTPSSSSTVRVSFAITSGSTSKYCNESLKGISGVPTSKEGATSSTGCKVLFKENQ